MYLFKKLCETFLSLQQKPTQQSVLVGKFFFKSFVQKTILAQLACVNTSAS